MASLPAQTLFDYQAETLSHVISLACLGWWANSKLLLIAFGRGSLRPSLPFAAYVACLLLPVLPADGATLAAPSRASTLAARFALKVAALGAIAATLASPPAPLPPLLRNVLFSLGLYTLIGALMDGPGALASWALRTPLQPHFDAPLLARGVGDFWRRWNKLAATLLKQSVYDPLVEGRRPAAPARHAVAVCATFAVRFLALPSYRAPPPEKLSSPAQVSGVAHELILWSATRERPRLQWLAFFALQGPVVIAEALACAALRRRGLRVPAALAVPATWAAVLLPATALFFPPPVRTGLDRRVVDSLRGSFHAAAAALGRI